MTSGYERRLESMPSKFRKNYERAMSGKSLRAAATAHCLECVMWVIEEVRLCTARSCPLYPYRPYQQKSGTAQKRQFPPVESMNATEDGGRHD
jgi:hypothetical protein